MKLAAICLLLLCSGFVYDFTLLGKPVIGKPKRLIAKLRKASHRHVTVPDLHTMIAKAARKHRVPAAFIKSIVAAESNFDCDAISPGGAIGPMQLMPETAHAYGADPRIPEQNIDAGTRYLRVLLDKYRNYRDCMPRVIAAYNAGPASVDRYQGVPPYRETRSYVSRVLGLLHHFEQEPGTQG
jgi:soluble lytic murein transglycosylase-like protein